MKMRIEETFLLEQPQILGYSKDGLIVTVFEKLSRLVKAFLFLSPKLAEQRECKFDGRKNPQHSRGIFYH